MFFTFCTSCTSCPACGLGVPVWMLPAGARYYTTFGEFHQLDDKKGLPFRLEA
jgi:hypothetical protein